MLMEKNIEILLILQKKYYQDLYKDELYISNVPIIETVGENSCQLNEEESNSLEGEITYEVLANVFKNMKNSKSPGMDGFTADFFKLFWVDLVKFILKSFKYLNSTVAKLGSVFIGLMTSYGAIWFRYQRALLMR